jgi:tetratricopeptide (TPR) repeat protein
MSVSAILDRIINSPGRIALFAALVAALSILVISAALLALNKHRRIARGLGIAALLLIMLVLLVFHEQTITDKPGPHVTLIQYAYPWSVRLPVRVALIVVPVVAVFVMSSVFRATKRWLRGQVPRLLKSGRRHSFQKEYAAALRQYNEAIKSAPELAEPYFQRGALYQTMGETGLALADYERALARDPRFAAAYLQRAKIHTESGGYETALADFGTFMSLRNNDPDGYLQRGICLMKQGMLEAAASDFQRVLKLTNHSDFSEPAKNYLSICQNPANSPSPASSPNGSPSLSAATQPRAHDVNR